MRIHYRSSISYPILQGRMSASRALPEPGEPPTTGARSPRRTSARAKRGEAGCRRRPDRRCRQIGREVFHGTPNTLADVRNASRKRTAKRGGSCARRARPSPGDTLVALVKPHYEGRRGRNLQASSGEGVLSSSPESDQIGTSIIDQRFPRLCGSGGLTAAGTC